MGPLFVSSASVELRRISPTRILPRETRSIHKRKGFGNYRGHRRESDARSEEVRRQAAGLNLTRLLKNSGEFFFSLSRLVDHSFKQIGNCGNIVKKAGGLPDGQDAPGHVSLFRCQAYGLEGIGEIGHHH